MWLHAPRQGKKHLLVHLMALLGSLKKSCKVRGSKLLQCPVKRQNALHQTNAGL